MEETHGKTWKAKMTVRIFKPFQPSHSQLRSGYIGSLSLLSPAFSYLSAFNVSSLFFILFYFILFYFILFYLFIYFILFYFVHLPLALLFFFFTLSAVLLLFFPSAFPFSFLQKLTENCYAWQLGHRSSPGPVHRWAMSLVTSLWNVFQVALMKYGSWPIYV
mgnify:CR=1 FL=1